MRVRLTRKEVEGPYAKVVTARALPSLLAMRSLASGTDPLRMSNPAGTRIGVLRGFSSLLLSSFYL
jgi:hypothetical protein